MFFSPKKGGGCGRSASRDEIWVVPGENVAADEEKKRRREEKIDNEPNLSNFPAVSK